MPRRAAAIATAMLCLLLALPAQARAEQKADTIAGVTLGQDIASYAKRVDRSTDMALWDRPWVKRVELLPTEGYKSGYVSYGTCAHPGRIMRVKLKYQDDSSKFFDKVKDAMTKAYGEHDEWRGNPFGTLKIWKWAVGKEPANVSVILQRYEGEDDSFTHDNSIRISVPEWEDQEMKCFQAKEAHAPKPAEAFMPTKKGMAWYLPY